MLSSAFDVHRQRGTRAAVVRAVAPWAGVTVKEAATRIICDGSVTCDGHILCNGLDAVEVLCNGSRPCDGTITCTGYSSEDAWAMYSLILDAGRLDSERFAALDHAELIATAERAAPASRHLRAVEFHGNFSHAMALDTGLIVARFDYAPRDGTLADPQPALCDGSLTCDGSTRCGAARRNGRLRRRRSLSASGIYYCDGQTRCDGTRWCGAAQIYP